MSLLKQSLQMLFLTLLSWNMGFNSEMFQWLSFMHSELNEGLQVCQTEMEVVCREENVYEFLFDTGIFYTGFFCGD